MPITVVVCTKDHDAARYSYSMLTHLWKLVNSMELEKQEIGLLKGYEASIRLRENCHPRDISKQDGNLEKVTHGEND